MQKVLNIQAPTALLHMSRRDFSICRNQAYVVSYRNETHLSTHMVDYGLGRQPCLPIHQSLHLCKRLRLFLTPFSLASACSRSATSPSCLRLAENMFCTAATVVDLHVEEQVRTEDPSLTLRCEEICWAAVDHLIQFCRCSPSKKGDLSSKGGGGRRRPVRGRGKVGKCAV